MSKDQWIAENEQIIEQYINGEISLGEAGDALETQGMLPADIRSMMSDHAKYPIPKGYFGAEK